ncbi:G-protein coupled receptor 157-like [Watersipora subatra]|uniref:G-protein coupled receptor 157-like n=1 Tax=Watersipora subatra TaxID=2589382 RepID=UPI00355B768C
MDTFNNSTEKFVCKCSEDYMIKEDLETTLNTSYYIMMIIMSALSIIGSITLVAIILADRKSLVARQLLIYLSLCDFLVALFNLLGLLWYYTDKQSDLFCSIQSGFSISSAIASFLWTFCIALNIYLTVVHQNKIIQKKLKYLPHIICWGIPAIIAIASACSDVLGYDPCVEVVSTCWINTCKLGNVYWKVLCWQMFTGKFWEILVYIGVAVLYGLVKCHISRHLKRIKSHSKTPASSQMKSLAYSSTNKKLIFVPLVFIIARIWGTLRFFFNFGHSREIQMIAAVLAPAQGLGDSAQGFLNSVIFIFTTPSVRNKLGFQKCKNLCSFSKSKSTFDLTSDEKQTSTAPHTSTES